MTARLDLPDLMTLEQAAALLAAVGVTYAGLARARQCYGRDGGYEIRPDVFEVTDWPADAVALPWSIDTWEDGRVYVIELHEYKGN